ncbi:hypothetical protein H696_01680 [Fonticula alba]|uniref:Uncharacterized protein n=1 Tax=Fonticula alba TaxID=691883 RepID=A0A058ZFN0_FONAL|nr:hypothetical protein H696_01680 [Fonticula alba]KCV72282.1 hypothetical protein H696_01680 [Fonticula alba]|eukprot:XP_009493860.1 hypothetical protein H696_01680 [Fonticula alba]
MFVAYWKPITREKLSSQHTLPISVRACAHIDACVLLQETHRSCPGLRASGGGKSSPDRDMWPTTLPGPVGPVPACAPASGRLALVRLSRTPPPGDGGRPCREAAPHLGAPRLPGKGKWEPMRAPGDILP